MSTPDKDIYRLVPYRFLINESNADLCKLEKLTNLFPDMKAMIELELFKINNLTRMVDRLSSIYTVLTAVDTRDDTLHLFLGPYHLLLGPSTFGALSFRNISTALLDSSNSKTSSNNTNQRHKRRHEAIIRRFRRAVRKLILIKSILNQLRLASILTPYNQYELYTQGVYDLVLAGHIHDFSSVFNDDDFTEQINKFRSMNKIEKDNSLLASRFIKINALLYLLSPPLNQHHSDNSAIPGKITQTSKSNDSNAYTPNENSPKPLIDSTSMCCSQHSLNIPLVMVSMNRSNSLQPTSFLSSEPRSRRKTGYNSSTRSSSASSNRIIRNSLPNLTIGDHFDTNISSSTGMLTSNSIILKSKTPTTRQPHIPSSQLNNNQEDAFVNRISALLTNYLLYQQSIPIPSHTNDNHEKLEDSTESLSVLTNEIASDNGDISNQFSSVIETNEFDKLLQRIKTIVDNNLSDHQISSHKSMKTTTTNNFRQQLVASHREISKDELDVKHLKSSINRHKLIQSSKSQSFDDIKLKSSSKTSELYDNSVEF